MKNLDLTTPFVKSSTGLAWRVHVKRLDLEKEGKKKREREKKDLQLTIQQNSHGFLPHLGVEYILKKRNRSFLLSGIGALKVELGHFSGFRSYPGHGGGEISVLRLD